MVAILKFFSFLWRAKGIILTLLILAGALVFGIKANTTNNSKKAAEERTYTVERKNIIRTETVVGTVTAKSQVEVKAKVGGILKEVRVKEGNEVKKGSILAVIDDVDLKKAYKLAQSRMELARAQYEKAKKGGTREQISTLERALKDAKVEVDLAMENLSRIETLYQKGYSSDQEYEDAKGRVERAKSAYEDAQKRLEYAKATAAPEDVKIAEAELKRAQLELEIAKEDLENAVIRSEVEGKVLSIQLEPGDMVIPAVEGREGNVIMIVGDTTGVLVKSQIGEDLIGILKEGMPVSFELSFIKDEKVKGEITRISHFGEPNENGVVMFDIEMILTEDIGEPRFGSTAKGEIIVGRAEQVLSLPVFAVTTKEGKPVVKKVISGKKTEEVEVEIGISDGKNVEIKKGLSEGDKVVAEAMEEEKPSQMRSAFRGGRGGGRVVRIGR